MIEAAIVALIAVAALVYVTAPLRRPRRDAPSAAAARVEEAAGRRRAAFGGLVDIEGERAMGKLSLGDFEALRAEYEAEALAALRELDELGAPAGTSDDDDLEAEIAALRSRLSCPDCGAIKTPGEPCEKCGAP